MRGVVHDSHVAIGKAARDHEVNAYVQLANDIVETVGRHEELTNLFFLTIS